MGVKIVTTRVACATGGGNQDITTAKLGGLTPVAVRFFIVRATANGTPTDNAFIGIGAATATDEQWVALCSSEHGAGTTDTRSRGATDECIMIIWPASGAIDGEASFVSFITNGVRINWGDAPAAAYLMMVEFWAGTDVEAFAGTFSFAAAEDATTDVTSPGFEPDVVLLTSPGRNFDDASIGDARLSHGVALNDVGNSQFNWSWRSREAQAAGTVLAEISDAYGISRRSLPDGEIGSWDANGFSCTTRNAAGEGAVGFLALKFNGKINFWAGIIDTPTSTGNQSQNGPAFTPQYIHAGCTHLTSLNIQGFNGDAGSVGIGLFDRDDEYCNSIQDEDESPTTDSQSLSDDSAINLPNDDGSVGHVAAFVNFTSAGWIWNFTTTEGTAVKYWALAIERERRIFVS